MKFDRMADNTGGVCDASFGLIGDFKVHPKESVIEVELNPNEPKIISWILTPQSAGYKIIQLEEGKFPLRPFVKRRGGTFHCANTRRWYLILPRCIAAH